MTGMADDDAKSMKFAEGTPGTPPLFSRATRLRLPDASVAQIPVSLFDVTPPNPDCKSPRKASLPVALSTGLKFEKLLKFAPATPGTLPLPSRAIKVRTPVGSGPQIPRSLLELTPPTPNLNVPKNATDPSELSTGASRLPKSTPTMPGTLLLPVLARRLMLPDESGPQIPFALIVVTPAIPV